MNSYFINTDVFIIPDIGKLDSHCPEKTRLLVFCEKEDFQSHSDLLHNILKAINFENDKNACILKLDKQSSVNVASITSDSITHVLSFGLSPKNLCLNAGFKANRFYKTESFSILLTHSLNQLEENKNYKMALWNALQNTFTPKK